MKIYRMSELLNHIIHDIFEGFPGKFFGLFKFRPLLVDEIFWKVVLIRNMLPNAADLVEIIQLVWGLESGVLFARIGSFIWVS